MTLLIGTVSQKCVVLTADGVSRLNPINGGGKRGDDQQKIFPHDSLPVALVHHGLNVIDGQSVKSRVIDFYNTYEANFINLSIKDITNKLIDYMGSFVERTFLNPNNRGIIGFWVTGYGRNQSNPILFEVCWPSDVEPKEHKPLVLGGDGQKFIEKFLKKKLGTFSPKKVKQYNPRLSAMYHGELYKRAEKNQKSQNDQIFGGMKHQLVIDKSGCQWLIPPVSRSTNN